MVTKCVFGIDRHAVVATQRLAGERVEGHQLVDLVAEQPDAQRRLFVGRVDLDDVAANAEGATPELDVVALVLDLDQLAQDVIPPDPLAALERQQQAVVRLGRTQAVDAADTLATITTSRRSNSERVAESRIRSISSLIVDSFSM